MKKLVPCWGFICELETLLFQQHGREVTHPFIRFIIRRRFDTCSLLEYNAVTTMRGVTMTQTTAGIRELKARLSSYMQQVKAGTILVITERGKPVGRIAPIKPSAEARMQELLQSGVVAWSGRKLAPMAPVARTQGTGTVAELLLENRE